MIRLLPFAIVALVSACDCGTPLEQLPSKIPVGHGEGRVLTYVGEDPLAMHFGDQQQLRFTRKNANGTPVDGDKIHVEVHGSQVSIAGDNFVTDQGGGIEVPVSAGTTAGEATVVARATDLDGSIDEAVVHIDVSESPVAGLVVTVVSQTRIPVSTANARIIDGVDPVTCADLAAGAQEPAPFTTATFGSFPSSQTFEQLPTHSSAVVVVDGFSSDGIKIASGCAQAGPLPGGLDTPVTVTLSQGASQLDGDYDVLMHIALGQALPAPYDTALDDISALLADPAGFALYFVLREIDRQTGFTTFVTDANGVEYTYDQVSSIAATDPGQFPTWSFARTQLNNFLTNQLGQTYTDVTEVGAGIRGVVTDFEVGTQLDVTQNTDGTLTVREDWKDMVFYWPLGCASGDLACARRPLTLDQLNLAPVTGQYGATVAYAPTQTTPESYAVTTDAHGLNLRYGALLVAILEQVVFPSLPGGVPNEDFGQFLQNIIGCSAIAQSVTSDPTAEQFVTGVCDAGLELAGGVIQTQLEQLQVDGAGPNVAGLQANGTFTLSDVDQDLVTETITGYDYAVGWNDPNNPATFPDISSPVTGSGFRVRPTCVDDGQCSTGFVCTPRASYLDVAQVNLGCERSKGSLTGGAACTADSQCGTGLCLPTAAAGALQCYSACATNGDCSSGESCSATGGAMNLDHVLNGLGDVAFAGCSAN